MNILQMEDMVKGMPDEVLRREAQMPSGQIPQFLSLSELQRRTEMRSKLQKAPEATVADQILQSGIAAAMPQQPPQGGMAPPPGGPPMGPPPGPQGAPVMAYGGGMMPYRMYGGGRTPGMVYMQEGKKVPGVELPSFGVNLPSFKGSGNVSLLALQEILAIPEELRTPDQQALIESITPQMEQPSVTPVAPQFLMDTAAPVSAPAAVGVPPAVGAAPVGGAVPPGAAPAPGATPDTSLDSFLKYTGPVSAAIEKMMPKPVGFDMAGYTKAFKPQEVDYLNPEFQKRRQEMVERLRTEAKTRREADMALAERYKGEAEAPIKKAEQEAKQAAIGAVLTRLGAGLMQGESAAGLASAAEGAEKILGRQRELSAAERRAATQEFRAAEREATRAERGSADQAFAMEAQNLTADENAQNQYKRDSKQFAQQVYGLMRDAGKDARAAHMESVRLTFSISQAIDTALREQKRETGLTERQYMQTFGSIYDGVLKAAQEAVFKDPVTGEEREPTADELIDFVNKKAQDTIKQVRLAAVPVKVATQDEYNKLPSGTVFIDPQGNTRKKP